MDGCGERKLETDQARGLHYNDVRYKAEMEKDNEKN